MNSLLLIGGFIILLGIIFAIYSLVSSPATVKSKISSLGAATQTNVTEPSKSAGMQIPTGLRIVMKQKFNAIGWVGVVLMFICPIMTGIVMNIHFSFLSRPMRYGYDQTNFGFLYLALGFASILAFIFVIIGRDFYSVASDR